jgi:hypothetical protein
MVKALAAIRDVDNVVIFSNEGEILANEKNPDPELDLNLGYMVLGVSQNISEIEKTGDLDRVVLSGSKRRLCIKQFPEQTIILNLNKRSSVEKVNEEVEIVYQRYQ